MGVDQPSQLPNQLGGVSTFYGVRAYHVAPELKEGTVLEGENMLKVIRALPDVRVFLLMLVVMNASAAHGQTTTFTYQGQLSDAGALANGSYDLRFALFDTVAGGAQIGANRDMPAVAVRAGVFTVQLDFGVSAFPGADRFVEIAVKPAGGGKPHDAGAAQEISLSPYAIRTLSAATADALSSACVGCVQNAQIDSVAGSKRRSGLIPAASLPAGSGNYVQNTTAQQASASSTMNLMITTKLGIVPIVKNMDSKRN